MSVNRLADCDVRLLTSGQVCTDVASIVKELIENALDAGASSVSLILEGHGLDKLTIKDDGTGIAEPDRQFILKRYHTSKLSSFSDLANIRTYGFRGEALASLAEISQSIEITTRTKSQAVATLYRTDSKDHTLKAVKSCSDPVGTTIVATKLFHNLPVRRQKQRKEANKILPSIKRLVSSYALVHHSMRFSVRMQSKSDAISIIHAPYESVFASFAAQYPSLRSSYKEYHQDSSDLQFHATLPIHTVPAAAMPPGRGLLLFVNNRPLSCARDVPKALSKLIKSYTSQIIPGVSDPIVMLRITCPPSSYDPNVEPSKDMILFHESDTLLESLKLLLDSVYSDDADFIELEEQPADVQGPANLIEEPIEDVSATTDQPIHVAQVETEPRTRKRSWKFSMFDDAESEDGQPDITSTVEQRGQRNVSDDDDILETSVPDNPWTIAKMTARPSKGDRTTGPISSDVLPGETDLTSSAPNNFEQSDTIVTQRPEARHIPSTSACALVPPRKRFKNTAEHNSLDSYLQPSSMIRVSPERSPLRAKVYNHVEDDDSNAFAASIRAAASPNKQITQALESTRKCDQVHNVTSSMSSANIEPFIDEYTFRPLLHTLPVTTRINDVSVITKSHLDGKIDLLRASSRECTAVYAFQGDKKVALRALRESEFVDLLDGSDDFIRIW